MVDEDEAGADSSLGARLASDPEGAGASESALRAMTTASKTSPDRGPNQGRDMFTTPESVVGAPGSISSGSISSSHRMSSSEDSARNTARATARSASGAARCDGKPGAGRRPRGGGEAPGADAGAEEEGEPDRRGEGGERERERGGAGGSAEEGRQSAKRRSPLAPAGAGASDAEGGGGEVDAQSEAGAPAGAGASGGRSRGDVAEGERPPLASGAGSTCVELPASASEASSIGVESECSDADEKR